MREIDWTPISTTFGARANIDFSAALPPGFERAWQQLFRARHLIVVPNANIDEDMQGRLAAMLGPICPKENSDGSSALAGYISNDESKGILGATELAFHSDLSLAPHPLDGISLYGLKLTAGTSSTRWVSGMAGHAALPSALQTRIKGLEIVNVISNVRRERNRFIGTTPTIPATRRPLVETDSAGMAYLYCNEAQTDHIIGLSAKESDAILDEIYAVLYAPEGIVEHVWQPGDLVIWNNLVLQHARGDVSGVGERTLRRFQLGQMGLRRQFPEFAAMIRTSYGRGVTPDDSMAS